jgi:hypothetical protein
MSMASRRKRQINPALSLQATHPDLASEAHGWDPREITPGSNARVTWKCPLGHAYVAAVAKRTGRGSGCPVCANRQVLVGFNDLATTHPDLARQADGWDPRGVTFGSGKRRLWRCDLGHQWSATPNRRTNQNSGCPYCSGQILLVGFNDLQTLHPQLALQADGWDPRSVGPGSKTSRQWKCDLGHSWNASPDNRSRGQGCPYCGNRRALPGFNDLATLRPEIAEEALGWDPSQFTERSSKKVKWRCKKGHEWVTGIANRTGPLNSGCPSCSGRVAIPGETDISTTHPILALEAVGWDPRTVKAMSNQKKRWKCERGHEWNAPPSDRVQGRGCPECAEFGFNPGKDGWLYFLEHDSWGMFQIGITNYPEKRLARHSRLGWTTAEVRGPMDGYLTRSLETAILRSIRKRKAMFASEVTSNPFDGWSEAWMSTSLVVSGIRELLDFVYADEAESQARSAGKTSKASSTAGGHSSPQT